VFAKKRFRKEFEEMKFIGDYQILREIGQGGGDARYKKLFL
jgi:hypothetical protein